MNYCLVYMYTLLLFSFIPQVEADSNHYYPAQKTDDRYCDEPNSLSFFYLPIKFTPSGMRCFLKHVYSNPEYPTEYLPYNFSHITEFLRYAKNTHQNYAYMQSIIRLFYNKVKASPFITSYALHELLDVMPGILNGYFTQQISSDTASLTTSIKKLLYTTFLERFSFFKTKPDEFFNELSHDIIKEAVGTISEQTINEEQLYQAIVRFLELVFNKTIWSTASDIWLSVKTFDQQLYALHETGVIDEDQLDDLYKSLLERFCYHLDLTGSNISLETLEIIKKDIAAAQLHFLTLEEQEAYIETKRQRLERALLMVQAKVHARSQGIISEAILKSSV